MSLPRYAFETNQKSCHGVNYSIDGDCSWRLLRSKAGEPFKLTGRVHEARAHRQLTEQLPAHALYHGHGPVAQEHGCGVLEVAAAALRGVPAVVGAHERQVVAAAPGALREVPLRQGGGPPGACLDGQHPWIPVTWALHKARHMYLLHPLLHFATKPKLLPFSTLVPRKSPLTSLDNNFNTTSMPVRRPLKKQALLARTIPIRHGAGDRQHRVQAAEEDAVQQHLSNAGRQRQGRQVSAQHSQLLCASLLAAQQRSGLLQSLQDDC